MNAAAIHLHRPAAQSQRLQGLDLARALAACGMVWVNLKIASHAAAVTPWVANLFDGRAAALFVVLAGVGVSLMHRAKGTGTTRTLLLRRALFLFVFGLAWSPLWTADILHFYGIYLTVAALVLRASDRLLLGLGAAVVAVGTGLQWTLDYLEGWDLVTLTITDVWTPAGMVRHLLFNGLHPVFPWLAFVFLGMWLGRQSLHLPAVRRRLLRGGLGLWAATELASLGLVHEATGPLGADVAAYLFGTAPLPPTALYVLAGGGLAVAAVAASLELAARVPARSWWLRCLSHTGQLALTVYIAHVPVALAVAVLAPAAPLPALALGSVVFCLAAVLAADAWRRRHGRGPAEALMRRMTG